MKCKNCDRTFKRKCDISRHINTKACYPTKVKCGICKVNFEYYTRYKKKEKIRSYCNACKYHPDTGRGFNATLEKWSCKFCNEIFENIKVVNVGNHVKLCALNPKRIDFLKNKVVQKEKKKKRSRKHTQETRKKISKACKRWIKNNKDKHNWSVYRNLESEPEKRFRKVIQTFNLEVYQYFRPQESDRMFELDFAIPELKIAFEVNGDQHYTKKGKLRSYYMKRHKHFEDLGWQVIEIPHRICFFDDKIVSIIKETISGVEQLTLQKANKALNHRLIRKANNKKKEKALKKAKFKSKQKSKKEKLLHEIKQQNAITKMINIHGNKYGIIALIANELNITHTHVRKLANKFNIDLYNRKNSRIPSAS